jgi:anti-sigma B factor antagonist
LVRVSVADQPEFEVSTQAERDRTVVTLEGELDFGVKERARAAIEGACDARVAVVDLRGLTFMDTSGVHLLLEARDRCRASGHRLLVVRGAPNIQRALTVLDLERELEFVDEPA